MSSTRYFTVTYYDGREQKFAIGSELWGDGKWLQQSVENKIQWLIEDGGACRIRVVRWLLDKATGEDRPRTIFDLERNILTGAWEKYTSRGKKRRRGHGEQKAWQTRLEFD